MNSDQTTILISTGFTADLDPAFPQKGTSDPDFVIKLKDVRYFFHFFSFVLEERSKITFSWNKVLKDTRKLKRKTCWKYSSFEKNYCNNFIAPEFRSKFPTRIKIRI